MSSTLYLMQMDAIRKKSKGADAAIADFLLSHPNATEGMTLQGLADATHTCYATVCRFFKKLGLSGFREFRKLYIGEGGEPTERLPDPEVTGNTALGLEQIAARIADYATGVIDALPRFLKKQDIARASELIRRAQQVHFVGLGTSAVTARYAYTKFFRLKPSCTCESDTILSKMRAAQMKPGDILFAISSSGRTKSILEIARLAKSSGAAVITLSDFENSPLSAMADIPLCTTVRDANKYIDTDFPLIQGQITVVDILYAYMYNQDPHPSSKKIRETKEAVTADKLAGTDGEGRK